jgi:hypothetical protein
MHFFHFSDTCYLGSNGSTKFLESTIIFDSFLEGHSSIGSGMYAFSRCQRRKCKPVVDNVGFTVQ